MIHLFILNYSIMVFELSSTLLWSWIIFYRIFILEKNYY